MSTPSSYETECQRWEDFLRKNDTHFIQIKKGKPESKASYIRAEYPSRTSYIFFTDVRKDNNSFREYLDKKIVPLQLGHITIYPKKKNGTGTLPVKENSQWYDLRKKFKELVDAKAKPAEVATKNTVSMNTEENKQVTPQPYMMPQVPQPPVYPQVQGGLGAATMFGMGGPAATAQAAGMGMSQFIDLQKNADRYLEVKDEFMKLKQEHHELILRNRTLESEKATAERDKDLAVRLIESDKRGFFDSETGKQIAASLPALFEMLANKSGGQSTPGLSAPSGMSVAKTQFMGYVNDPSVTDEMLTPLSISLFLLTENPEFAIALNQLNQTYGGNNSN